MHILIGSAGVDEGDVSNGTLFLREHSQRVVHLGVGQRPYLDPPIAFRRHLEVFRHCIRHIHMTGDHRVP